MVLGVCLGIVDNNIVLLVFCDLVSLVVVW